MEIQRSSLGILFTNFKQIALFLILRYAFFEDSQVVILSMKQNVFVYNMHIILNRYLLALKK